MSNKKLIGYAAVDSGQLIVVDPCYLDKWKDGAHDDTGNHYGAACAATMSENQGGEVLVSGIAGNGVAFSTGLGDGNYPVYAEYSDEGDFGRRVKRIVIDFL